MVESLPVTICVAESCGTSLHAARCSREMRNGHDSALPSTVVRKNSRRVWSVIHFFILFKSDW